MRSPKPPLHYRVHYVYSLAYPESMGGHTFYIGKGVNDRINEHEREARRVTDSPSVKTQTIREIWKAGGEIVKTILAYFDNHEDAGTYETALIFFLPNLINVMPGGEGYCFVEIRRLTFDRLDALLQMHLAQWGEKDLTADAYICHVKRLAYILSHGSLGRDLTDREIKILDIWQHCEIAQAEHPERFPFCNVC